MAVYVDEEEVWKCLKHPSKRRKTGICPVCLRDRLKALCPDCANVRPCSCCNSATTSASSSSSSSGRAGDGSRSSGLGSVGRVSNLIDNEPSFRRSRSVAIPFLRSRSRFPGEREYSGTKTPAPGNWIKSSLRSLFRLRKNKKGEVDEGTEDEEVKKNETELPPQDDYVNGYVQQMMMRSRSVSVPVASDSIFGDFRSSSTRSRGRGWHFPSPIKYFQFSRSRTPRVVQEQSPLYRG